MIFAICLTELNAQVPPRLSIPGAVPVPPRSSPLQFRNERLLAANGNSVGGGPNSGFVRIRRPVLAARQNQLNGFPQNNLPEEAKPVTEDNESGENTFFVAQQQQQRQEQPTLQSLQGLHQQHQQHQQQQQLSSILYSTDENGEIVGANQQLNFPSERFNPIQEKIVPTTIRTTGAQRYSLNQDRVVQTSTPKPVRVICYSIFPLRKK